MASDDLHYSNDDEVNGVTPRWVTPNSHVAPSMSTDSSMSSSYCVVISDDDEEEEEKEARSGETSSSSARSPPKNESESYEVTDPVVLKDTHWKMLEGGFLCSLCDTTVVHEAQLRDHIKGKRHQKNLNYLEWERYSQSDDSARANDTTIATSTIPAAAADATQRIPTTLRSARSGVIDVVHGNEDPNDQHHIPSDPVSGWLDNVEMDDYTSQCNRQFWTTAGEPRTHGIVDFEGLEGGFYAPAHCVYDAMYCCLCEAKPDGWWKWTEHFKGKKHLKHVSSARSTHIAYWQKLSAGTGVLLPTAVYAH
ncbi:hypothetical protein Pmar_PMAR026948 [Perkinsus marinus ATCC 50983]|uniref:C2H2-type domain-containing protein n=1 Tax=Perkinsus marinus (strain ATCC 50983 / TXsc) TaxID=423536 RepID=C5L1U6_PERM5|nr:hypothetical protein Pmar_PMAR026948 [Perkinsus marinus ATCC 50983]EER09297.1 hypothetical protein Pmar_PMAR026948 [Perkinsus marinus ATCC 50983]|eukprot:XP_002777481.1 hypothetical protein Pmar_PMAR026948 [Perkinsus marinus ATCC 50983]